MPRVSKVDSCMFCGEAPCVCNKKVSQPKAPRAPRKKTEPIAAGIEHVSDSELLAAPAQKADITSAMRAAAKIKHVGATVKEDRDAVYERDDIASDPEMSAAIRALAPLMHPMERTRFKDVLQSEPSPAERALVWRRKVNGDG